MIYTAHEPFTGHGDYKPEVHIILMQINPRSGKTTGITSSIKRDFLVLFLFNKEAISPELTLFYNYNFKLTLSYLMRYKKPNRVDPCKKVYFMIYIKGRAGRISGRII